MKIRFDEEKCVGCYACYTACIAAHHSPEEEDAKSHRVIQKVVKEDFQKNICVGCIHCGLCMEKCPKGAIYKEARYGLILVEKEKCAGCGVCQSVCPKGVIHFDAEGRMEKCDGCIGRLYEGRQPACVRVCCVGAIESKLPVL
ncbi:MAG: 4Fe-4S binding protein [Dorea sp.]|jgi:Fe-S-cluster-containing hydrogenase components 1|uniref:4Fe-4S dicluster domain-containing protein n=1 Tax=Sporofaciens musculi TaxID=2681861 RepID=UPI002173EE75|nr:4Fe-4S dicluster domain-containing protein [Sporofaciens musculi]MCI9421777.1 4Fe-4S binding protein [Dorea sp.]